MALFEEKGVTDIVTPKDIRNMTGVKASDFYFDNKDNEDESLDELLSTWIERVAAHIEVRGVADLTKDSAEFVAIQDVIIRTVAKVVAIAQQQRTSPIVQISDFAVSVLNTSDVVSDLNKELRPFLHGTGKVSVFSSLGDYHDEDEEVYLSDSPKINRD